jgi:hypothetical protein
MPVPAKVLMMDPELANIWTASRPSSTAEYESGCGAGGWLKASTVMGMA